MYNIVALTRALEQRRMDLNDKFEFGRERTGTNWNRLTAQISVNLPGNRGQKGKETLESDNR